MPFICLCLIFDRDMLMPSFRYKYSLRPPVRHLPWFRRWLLLPTPGLKPVPSLRSRIVQVRQSRPDILLQRLLIRLALMTRLFPRFPLPLHMWPLPLQLPMTCWRRPSEWVSSVRSLAASSQSFELSLRRSDALHYAHV